MSAGRKHFPIPSAGVLKAAPPAPAWLGARAGAIWHEVATAMVAGGMLAPLDLPTLANYCCALARVEECEAFLAVNGCTVSIRDDKGTVKQIGVAPEFTISAREREVARKLAGELGLSPTARAKMAGENGARAGALALLAPGV